jgi:hypothetical protein
MHAYFGVPTLYLDTFHPLFGLALHEAVFGHFAAFGQVIE